MLAITQIFIQGTLGGGHLRDIKPPVEVSPSLLPYLIGGAVILGGIAASVWLYKRRQRQEVPLAVPDTPKTRLPHEVAYEKLAAIEASDWLEQGNIEIYYTQIAYVLRQYIKARYEIPALALTTTALFQAMRSADIAMPYVEGTQRLLASCDMVKFAPYQPAVSEATTRIRDVRWIVDETKAETKAEPVQE